MLSRLLTAETVQIRQTGDLDWRAAIKKAAEPLLHAGKIETSYVDAMISLVEEHGPYINIGPDIALAHARPENGVHEMGLSLMKVEPAVNLVNAEHPVRLFFVLAAVDNTNHLEVMKELVTILQDPENVKKLEDAKTVSEIIRLIKGENER